MVSLLIFCIIVGAMLGMRFKVLILVPATAVILLFAAGVSLTAGAGLIWAMIDVGMAATALQVGYLGGAATGLLVTASELRAVTRPADPRLL